MRVCSTGKTGRAAAAQLRASPGSARVKRQFLRQAPEAVAGLLTVNRWVDNTQHRELIAGWLTGQTPTAQAQFLREQRQLDEPPFNMLIDQLSEALRA